MQVASFCCFRQGVARMSRDLGRDVPDLGKLYARELWADFSFPTFPKLLPGWPRFGSVMVWVWNVSGGSGFRLGRFVWGKGVVCVSVLWEKKVRFRFRFLKTRFRRFRFGLLENGSGGPGFRFRFGSWAFLRYVHYHPHQAIAGWKSSSRTKRGIHKRGVHEKVQFPQIQDNMIQ